MLQLLLRQIAKAWGDRVVIEGDTRGRWGRCRQIQDYLEARNLNWLKLVRGRCSTFVTFGQKTSVGWGAGSNPKSPLYKRDTRVTTLEDINLISNNATNYLLLLPTTLHEANLLKTPLRESPFRLIDEKQNEKIFCFCGSSFSRSYPTQDIIYTRGLERRAKFGMFWRKNRQIGKLTEKLIEIWRKRKCNCTRSHPWLRMEQKLC